MSKKLLCIKCYNNVISYKGNRLLDNINLCWLRQDLRLSDNPALFQAANEGTLVVVFILDTTDTEFALGEASKWWLHHSLDNLNKKLNNQLRVYKGNPAEILLEIVSKYNINNVYWNRCYEPNIIKRDTKIKQLLKDKGANVYSSNGSLLWEPFEILKKDLQPYQVFTPYYKGCLNAKEPRTPLPAPDNLNILKLEEGQLKVADLELLSPIPWADKFEPIWEIGEVHAGNRLFEFIKDEIEYYKFDRDFPAKNLSSHLSPYLHFGEISPNQVWYTARQLGDDINANKFISELAWREFANYIIYHNPKIVNQNLQEKFDAFPWITDEYKLSCWKTGNTGFPLVDAGMRELWQTGFMHNRVRMVVASFLTKNLLIDWQIGAKWFWDCLLDADLANNSMGWQWVAGCGVDAAPFFRIFNPTLQGQKFDQKGEYTRKYVPELKNLPDKYLFTPWLAPVEVLKSAGIELGNTYPAPIVDIQTTRVRALEAYKSINNKTK